MTVLQGIKGSGGKSNFNPWVLANFGLVFHSSYSSDSPIKIFGGKGEIFFF